jgi:hypothetical protein
MFLYADKRLYKTVKFLHLIFNFNNLTIKYRFDCNYLTLGADLSCCCPYTGRVQYKLYILPNPHKYHRLTVHTVGQRLYVEQRRGTRREAGGSVVYWSRSRCFYLLLATRPGFARTQLRHHETSTIIY